MKNIEDALAIANIMLSGIQSTRPVTESDINEVVLKLKMIKYIHDDSIVLEAIYDKLCDEYLDRTSEYASLLSSDDVEPWIHNLDKTKFDYWKRYKTYLSRNDNSFPIDDLDKITDVILDKCVNPNIPGRWDRRGMVVGNVQSGKTANYIGLINKAIDTGYKLIIVIAGSLGSLRIQTQLRVDSGVIGRNSAEYAFGNRDTKIGVGEYPIKGAEILSYTTSRLKPDSSGDDGDFSSSLAQKLNYRPGKNNPPIILVIKKDYNILENVINHMASYSSEENEYGFPEIKNVPTLIIDDEADYASVNTTNSLNEFKRINRLIRILSNLFSQTTFIGYTATPYANLFIPQEFNEENYAFVKGVKYQIGPDLFPRHFIVNLHPSNRYVGASRLFGYKSPVNEEDSIEPLPLFREVNDFEPSFPKVINKNNKDELPDSIPASLDEAILSFILVCAIRRVRGQITAHNSMLINVASFIKWIDKIAYLVNERLNDFKLSIESDDVILLNKLEKLYKNDFVYRTEQVVNNLEYKDSKIKVHEWDDIRAELKNSVRKINVRALHSCKKVNTLYYQNIEELDYNKYKDVGVSVIAVGGNRLSRGITLEGLSISYFQRTTKMYDSLMQMGRWFGYRPGYLDLCRLYTSSEIYSWFEYINDATEEMRNDFDEMMLANKRPIDYQLKVKSHPGMLIITSLNKMYFTDEIELSFSGTNPLTHQFVKTEKVMKHNFECYQQFFSSLVKSKCSMDKSDSYYLFKNVDINHIIKFLDIYKTEQKSINNSTLGEYIKLQYENHNILEWNVGFMSNSRKKNTIKYPGDVTEEVDASYITMTIDGKDYVIYQNVRNNPDRRKEMYYCMVKNQLDSTKDRFIDINKNFNPKTDSIKDNKEFRSKLKRGLILLYTLDERAVDDAEFGVPFVGYSIHFPLIENEEKVKYKTSIYSDFDKDVQEELNDVSYE